MSLRDFQWEYKEFVREYVLPLMGLPRKKRQFIDVPEQEMESRKNCPIVIYDRVLQRLCFTNGKSTIFYTECNDIVTEKACNLAANLCVAFFKVSPYHQDSYRRRTSFYSNVHREKVSQMAIQRGISTWVVGNENGAIEELLNLMEKWAVQTYEGKKVTFGFVITLTPSVPAKSLPKAKWLKFLSDDYSAVLTDCIHSVIQLDGNCRFIRFLSLSDNGTIPLHTLSPFLPLRFSQCIYEHVHDDAVGIFLLNNGDIVLSKDREIKFVKRNLRWLNFSFDAFRAAACSQQTNWDEFLLKEIYATMLDVSFAHTGGILSIVRDPGELRVPSNSPVLKPYDDLLRDPPENCLDKLPLKDKEMTQIKRQVIKMPINDKRFPELDRKLRSELTAMDGACILDAEGNVVSFGAIIRSDTESSGGARGAASRTLSHYGMAVKISTDGYVELYLDRNKVLEIK